MVTEDFYNRIKEAGEKDPKYDNIIKYIDLSKVTAAAPAGGKSMKEKILKIKRKISK